LDERSSSFVDTQLVLQAGDAGDIQEADRGAERLSSVRKEDICSPVSGRPRCPVSTPKSARARWLANNSALCCRRYAAPGAGTSALAFRGRTRKGNAPIGSAPDGASGFRGIPDSLRAGDAARRLLQEKSRILAE
jgi:hypothetical protein